MNLQLVYSQYHAESASFVSSPISLKVGKNEISMKELQSIGVEKVDLCMFNILVILMKRLLLEYQAVKKIATLDLYQVSDENERLEKVKTYLQSLQTQINKNVFQNTKNFIVMTIVRNYDYDEKNCILGATEIMLDHMLYSSIR